MLRFRRFSRRLLFWITGLVALALGGAYLSVRHLNRARALVAIDDALFAAADRFERQIARELEHRTREARLMAGDYALRQTLGSDPATLRTLLLSYAQRMEAPWLVLFAADGAALADTTSAPAAADTAAFTPLIERAQFDESPDPRATGFALVAGKLQVLLVVPVFAPRPEIVAWLGIGLPIEGAAARDLAASQRVDVTFATAGDEARVLTSTVAAGPSDWLSRLPTTLTPTAQTVRIGGRAYVTLVRRLPLVPEGEARLILQRSLADELAPARLLEDLLLSVTVASIGAAALLALWLARSLSQPVRQLAAHTRVIGGGDYTTRLDLRREDELGELALALNTMSGGLAERDRMRDLLDKNLSPEVAAQLLREGTRLGGEVRCVTVLFCDLQGFTALSESLPPVQVLGLLNRVLDRLAAAIEAEGGVIDKFIGDAIMALFSAPLPQLDAADRALLAAGRLVRALAALNTEFAAEGLPVIGLGVGINTAEVVAGNIGSHRRLNYSVIGDGVNVAARLEALTRDPTLDAQVLCSAATLAATRTPHRTRDLGLLALKGRREKVHVFAVETT